MPNRPRPRCPGCDAAMEPLYRKRTRGSTYARVPDVFWCDECAQLGRGRQRTAYVGGKTPTRRNAQIEKPQ